MPFYSTIKKFSFISVCLIVFTLIAKGQSLTSSLYSQYGFGEINTNGTFLNTSLGNGGVGFASPFQVNSANPAASAHLSRTTVETALINKAVWYSKTNESAFQNNSSFSNLVMAFPLKKIAFSAGILPYSSRNYNYENKTKHSFSDSVTYSYSSTGSINKTFLGLSSKIIKLKKDTFWLSVGLQGNLFFGNTVTKGTQQFQALSLLYGSYFKEEIYNFGLGTEFGLQSCYKFKKADLIIGASFTPKTNLNSYRSVGIANYVYSSLQNNIEEGLKDSIYFNSDTSKSVLPQTMSFGFSIMNYKNWSFNTGATLTKWSDARFLGLNYGLLNTTLFHLAAEFNPDNKTARGFFTHTVYRFSTYYQPAYYMVNGRKLTDMGVGISFCFPVPKSFTKFNFGVQLGQFGTQKDNLILQRYMNFTLGISFSDVWFQKSKIE